MARTKRTFKNFIIAVANESKRYPSLKKHNGQFNHMFLQAAFYAGQNARQCCNSMTEEF